jgi:hypothetical protein
MEMVPTAKHVVYIGDSILRTFFCGHVYPELHDGRIDGDCRYSEDIGGYHYSSKSFNVTTAAGAPVRFSQRFIQGQPQSAVERIRELVDLYPDEPVTHIVTNVGLWLARNNRDDYTGSVLFLLETLANTFGERVHITWLDTVSTSPGVYCWKDLKRAKLRYHGDWARDAINDLRERRPGVRINQVDAYRLSDSRPETSWDGR